MYIQNVNILFRNLCYFNKPGHSIGFPEGKKYFRKGPLISLAKTKATSE